MSAIHRIDDIYSMDGRRFLAFVERLPYYQGVMKVKLMEQIAQEQEAQAEPDSALPLTATDIGEYRRGTPPPGASTIPDPETIKLRRKLLYADAGVQP